MAEDYASGSAGSPPQDRRTPLIDSHRASLPV